MIHSFVPTHRQSPLPSLGRMMVFIDGENLVLRYQAMLDDGRISRDEVVHEPDVFVWQPASVRPGMNVVLRATYYTYAVGDEARLREVREMIRNLQFTQYDVPGAILPGQIYQLYPKVFKKAKGTRGKGVDIQMTVDILTHVYQNNLDVLYLVAGDGDYHPLVDEAIRMGKQVFIAALSSGLSDSLIDRADRLHILDSTYFKP